jgi:hypothetical protein
MNQQVAQFANTSAQIMQLLGPEAGANHIANSLFAVNMGSNDFLNNYFAPFSPIGNLSAEAVNSLILSTLEQQLTVTATCTPTSCFWGMWGWEGCWVFSLYLPGNPVFGAVLQMVLTYRMSSAPK